MGLENQRPNALGYKDAEARKAIEKAKARVLYLPPYSPDLNPNENLWPKTKNILRKMKERTVSRLLEVAKEAVGKVTPNDCIGYFKNCGY